MPKKASADVVKQRRRYIDAHKVDGRFFVSSKDENGKRSVLTHRPEFSLYYIDPEGPYTSIYGDKLSRFTSWKYREFRAKWETMKEREEKLFEVDFYPLHRILEERYPGDDGPPLNIQVIDIEVDKDPELGFASPTNPYAPINAVSIHNKWDDNPVTIIMPPENLTMEECRKLLDGEIYQDAKGNLVSDIPKNDDFGQMPQDSGYHIVPDEETLLLLIIELLQEADVVTGWNSESFDLPYIIARIRIVLGGETIQGMYHEDGSRADPMKPSEKSKPHLQRLCLFPCMPTLKMMEKYGNDEKIFMLHGRVHLDYLPLYRKFTQKELHSYSLDSVLRAELDQQKVAYDGSLDQLYRWDFRRFTAYSRQDTMGLSALDDKLKFLDLANSMAHLAGVTIDKVIGTVTMVEQAILKEVHRKGLICYDPDTKGNSYPVPGASVLEPQKGLYHWIASYDFNSLYPTVIRMLNISPETIVGEVRPNETLMKLHSIMANDGLSGAEAWAHFPGTLEYRRVVEKSDEEILFHEEKTDEVHTLTGAEMNTLIRENGWVITAFGLVLTRDQQGIIPFCLEKWYKQRQEYQKKKKRAIGNAKSLEDGPEKVKALAEVEYFDRRQMVQKLFLNSTYGALLNKHCLFYDSRMGASVTMSGRICWKTMVDYVENVLETETL